MNNNTSITKENVTCSNCGKPIQRFLGASAYTIICSYCETAYYCYSGSLEKSTASFKKVYKTFDIPIGSKGTIKGIPYIVVGICRKKEKNSSNYWNEYLLFNPLKGYATLAEYNGHWNYVVELHSIPTKVTAQEFTYEGNTYALYSTYGAQTPQAVGEFPFKLISSYEVRVSEYISPPYMLSIESSQEEYVWYKGEYIKGQEIKKAFQLEKITPKVGVGSTQPFVSGFRPAALANLSIFLILLFTVLYLFFYYDAKEQVVFNETYFITDSTAKKEIYTKPFDLKGGTKNLEIRINTNIDNTWMYTGFTLVNEATGDLYELEIEAEYYHGYDDGAWTEGSSWNSKVISQVPEGKYYLIIYPDRQLSALSTKLEIVVTRDVVITSNMLLALIVTLIFPAIYFYRKKVFEEKRWQ